MGRAVGGECRRLGQASLARRDRSFHVFPGPVRPHAAVRHRKDLLRQLAVVEHGRVADPLDRRDRLPDPDSSKPRLRSRQQGRRVGRGRGSREPQMGQALVELLLDRPRHLDLERGRKDRARGGMEISIGATEAGAQPRAAVEPRNQDTLADLAVRAPIPRLIDFLTTARTRLLSGHVLVGRAVTLSFGRGVASLLSAAWLILVARRLSLEQFGEVSVALALVIILTALSDLGLQTILAKDVVEMGHVRRAVLDAVILRRLMWALISCVLLVVLYVVATHDRNLATPILFSLSIVGAALYNPTITAYRASGNIRLEIVSEIGSRAVVLVGGGLWVLSGGGVIAVAVVYSAVGLGIGLIDYLLVRSHSTAGAAAGTLPSFSIRAAAPFALANTIGAVYQRIDNYLVALLRGTAAAGIYGASYRFQDMNVILPAALRQLALSEAKGQDPRSRLSTAKRVAAQSALLAVVPAIVIAVFAQPLLVFLFGARFAIATPIVVVLMLSTLPGAIAMALSSLAAITDPKRFAAATSGSLLINVVANLILIPPFSGLGAAVANVISLTLLAAAFYWALWRRTRELVAAPRP